MAQPLPPIGGVDLSQGRNLGGPSGDGEIDLTKTITDQDFRAGLLALAAGINDSLGIIAFHMGKGLPVLAAQGRDVAMAVNGLTKVAEGMGVIEIPEGGLDLGVQQVPATETQDADATEA